MAMHPEIAGMLHQFIAAMPEAQTMDPSGQPMAGAPAQPEQAPVGGQLGSFGATVGTAEQALEQADSAPQAAASNMIKAGEQASQAQGIADTAKIDNENVGIHAIAALHKDFMPKLDAMDKSLDEAMSDAHAESSKAYDTYLRASSDFAQTHIYSWWSKASTGAQILGVISQIAAGAAQGLNGQIGAKTPLDHIIDRDLEEQKMNLGQKGEAVQNAKGVYNDLRATLKDSVATGAAMREVAYNSIKVRAESLAAQTTDAGAKGRLLQLSADMTTRSANIRTDVNKWYGSEAVKTAFNKAGVAGHFAGLYAAAAGQTGKESTVGLSDVAGDTEALAKQAPTVFADVQKKTAAANNALTALNDLRERLGNQQLIKGEPLVDFNAKNNALLSAFMTNMNTLAALGALSEGDSQKLLQQAGISGEFGTGSSAKSHLPGSSYAAMSSRMGSAVKSLHTQISTDIGSIKVGGRALQYTRALPKGLK